MSLSTTVWTMLNQPQPFYQTAGNTYSIRSQQHQCQVPWGEGGGELTVLAGGALEGTDGGPASLTP